MSLEGQAPGSRAANALPTWAPDPFSITRVAAGPTPTGKVVRGHASSPYPTPHTPLPEQNRGLWAIRLQGGDRAGTWLLGCIGLESVGTAVLVYSMPLRSVSEGSWP